MNILKIYDTYVEAYFVARPNRFVRCCKSGTRKPSTPLERQDRHVPGTSESAEHVPAPKPKLRTDKLKHAIMLDSKTSLHGVPPIAWEYKLGNRSALEWILDQYKEKTPKDPTIREKFNTYRFTDYKEHVIDLLKRVCTVSVRTMEIIQAMQRSATATLHS